MFLSCSNPRRDAITATTTPKVPIATLIGSELPAKPDRNGIVAAATDLGKTQPPEPALIRNTLAVIPAYLIVQTLLDVLLG
jgi:hypothetical protein